MVTSSQLKPLSHNLRLRQLPFQESLRDVVTSSQLNPSVTTFGCDSSPKEEPLRGGDFVTIVTA